MVSNHISTNWDMSCFLVQVSWNSFPWVGGLLIAFSYISKNFRLIIYITFNIKIEKLNKKKMIFTILSRVPSIVVEPPVCRKPPRVDSLLVQAFTCFFLNAGESQWALKAWRISSMSQWMLAPSHKCLKTYRKGAFWLWSSTPCKWKPLRMDQ